MVMRTRYLGVRNLAAVFIILLHFGKLKAFLISRGNSMQDLLKSIVIFVTVLITFTVEFVLSNPYCLSQRPSFCDQCKTIVDDPFKKFAHAI